MGSDRSGTYLRGLLVPDPRISADSLTLKTDPVVPSAYTQAGPFAGPPEAYQATNLVLRTSGDQTGDGEIEVRTQRSGGVAREGAGLVWRDVAGGDADTEYKGQDAHGLITDFEALLYTGLAEGATIRPHVIRLASGRLLCSYSVTSLGVVRISRYDPATSAWTAVDLAPTGAGSGYITGAVTICQIDSGRILAYCLAFDQQQVDLYYSDDDGTTWTAGGYRVLDVGVTEDAVTGMRAAWSSGSAEVLLIVLWSNSTTAQATATQYASADLGTEFTRVLTDWELATSESIETVDIVPMDGGGFCVVYIDEQPTNDVLQRRRIGSAFEPLSSATAALPDVSISPALDDVTAWGDDNDTMWLIVGDGTGSGRSRIGALYRSLDQGDTWEHATDGESTHGLHTGVTVTNRLTSYSATSIGGRIALVSRWTAAGSGFDPNSIAVLWYAGYSTHTAPVGRGLTNKDFRDTDYIGWGYSRATQDPGGVWFAVEVPASVDWTAAGAGTDTLQAPGELEIVTGAGGTRTFERVLADSVESVFIDVEVEIDAGDGSTAAEEITLTVRIGNWTWAYEVQVRLSSAGYLLYDTYAAADVSVAVAFDLTTRGHIRLAMDPSGYVRTWHCRAGHVRQWSAGPSASGLTDGGGSINSRVLWGHTAAAANVSRWTMLGYSFNSGKWSGTQTGSLASSWSNPADLHPLNCPTARPALLTDGIGLEAIGGPSLLGETQRLRAAYDYPLRAIYPAEAPSPAKEWRSTVDNEDAALVWDLEADIGGSASFWESSSIGAFLVGANFRAAKFQGWTGAAWDDILSLDAASGYTGINMQRAGRIVWRDTGSGKADPTGERWSPHEAHAGDTLATSDGEINRLHRIAHNSEGGWRSGSKLARLNLDPDTVDVATAASFNADIWRRNFGGIAHNVSTTYKYVRLFIPRQKTVDGYYRIGSLAIGPVFVFGLQYGNGWAVERAVNVELSTRDSGVRSARSRGAGRRAVEISWTGQAQDTSRMWDAEPSPDYVTGVDSGDPVASVVDTAYQVLGLVERQDGPSTPVVYLGRMARGVGSHLYTMDAEWLYGRIVTDTPSLDHVVGDEGVSPLVRLNRIRIEEEV